MPTTIKDTEHGAFANPQFVSDRKALVQKARKVVGNADGQSRELTLTEADQLDELVARIDHMDKVVARRPAAGSPRPRAASTNSINGPNSRP